MNDTKIELTLGLVNGILQYLGTRPYAEAVPQIPTPDPAAEPAGAGLND